MKMTPSCAELVLGLSVFAAGCSGNDGAMGAMGAAGAIGAGTESLKL